MKTLLFFVQKTMIAWLSGTDYTSTSVPIAQWTAVLEHELRSELLLRADQFLGIDMLALPNVVVPSEFDAPYGNNQPDVCAHLLVEAIFNFVSALRLPVAANRFLFIVSGHESRPVLVRRAAQLVDVSMVTLERVAGSLRNNQCRVLCRRTGLVVAEQIISSRWDLRQQSASQCVAALLCDHFGPGIGTPLANRVMLKQTTIDELIAVVARERASLEHGRALTGLCYLYLCDATNIAVCNELIEEATRFAERITERNAIEELARVAALIGRYMPRLRACVITPQQLVSIVREIARQLFGVDIATGTQ